MFRRKAIMMIIIAMLISVTYIFAIDSYDAKPDELQWFKEQLSQEKIQYNEVGIQIEGMVYNESLELRDVQSKLDEMSVALSHNGDCSKLCKVVHPEYAVAQVKESKQVKEGSLEASEANWNYVFDLKNQQDIHYNSYYNLKITGGEDMETLDMLRSRGSSLLKEWEVKAKETIYFKGFILGKLTTEERTEIKDTLLKNLEAKSTNYYEDDLSGTTCAYYGYTQHVRDYIKEENGQKTNVQISFKYDEVSHRTDVIVAFPFYNEPF